MSGVYGIRVFSAKLLQGIKHGLLENSAFFSMIFPLKPSSAGGFPSDHRRVTENEPTYRMVDSWLLISHIIGLYQDTDD